MLKGTLSVVKHTFEVIQDERDLVEVLLRMTIIAKLSHHPSHNHLLAIRPCIFSWLDLPPGLPPILDQHILLGVSLGWGILFRVGQDLPPPPMKLSATGKKIKAWLAAKTTNANHILK